MIKKECYECHKEIKNNSAFCPHCGCDLSKDKIECSKCKKINSRNSKFCEKCGAKLKNEKTDWNFNNKIITITFWICSILTIYLLGCPGFVRTINLFKFQITPILGFTLICVGLSLSFFFNKDDIDIKKEIDLIKKIKLSVVQIGFIFIIAGIFNLLGLGSHQYGEIYLGTVFILLISFMVMIGVIIYNNLHKFSSIGQITCLILSVISFLISGYFYNYGNELNSSYESQLESFWNNGTANPGNEYLSYSRYALIIGIILIVIFFVLRTCKEKKSR